MKPEEIIASPIFNLSDFAFRAGIDIIALFILVGLIYYPKYKNKDFVFTFSIFNVINFMICYLLGTAKIQMGFAFGLFAIFSIIRYRTIMISIKDMGYFFICVALGMLNSLADSTDGYLLLIVCNLVILGITLGLDRLNFISNENSNGFCLWTLCNILHHQVPYNYDLDKGYGLFLYLCCIGDAQFIGRQQ